MYSRRLAIARATGRMKTTFKIAKKIAKLSSWTKNVPSSFRNMLRRRYLMNGLEKTRNVHDHEQQVERQTQRDNRKRFQNADAEEHEQKDVGTRFGLA